MGEGEFGDDSEGGGEVIKMELRTLITSLGWKEARELLPEEQLNWRGSARIGVQQI